MSDATESQSCIFCKDNIRYGHHALISKECIDRIFDRKFYNQGGIWP